jgi:predicted AAA+ superfamily ATPase
MLRALDAVIRTDLARKMVLLTGPRQVGKTTLARQLMGGQAQAAYLNWDVASDRAVLQRQSWPMTSRLLVFDEIHKMPGWKAWLKGVVDGRPEGQMLLVTGSARMDTFRQGGESLAGRYLSWRLHPISVREWCEQPHAQPRQPGQALQRLQPDQALQRLQPDQALQRLMSRGGFPEPFLADDDAQADRWRHQYITDLVREDVLEFSRVQEIGTMRLFLDLLRERVGSPLSLASIARDLAVSPTTLKRYLDILQALFIVFTVPPWHRNVARAIQQMPKLYFYDTGLVRGDEGLRYENAVAAMLLKHAQFLADGSGHDVGLHHLRTKDGAEVDFALSRDGVLTDLIECKLADARPHRALQRFAQEFPQARAVQLVRDLRQEEDRPGPVQVRRAAAWLAALAA